MMIYMVEHGFADPTHEAEWNNWYTHHATYAFRSVPGWRTGQRFVAVGASTPRYRAMYTVENASVLTSLEYKKTTGGRFPEKWRPMITDFHRNLADGDSMPPVPEGECLIVADPPAVDTDVPEAPLRWWNIVGLDRSVERRAIAVVSRVVGEALVTRAVKSVGVYSPVCERWAI
jgi:hypothetical protein